MFMLMNTRCVVEWWPADYSVNGDFCSSNLVSIISSLNFIHFSHFYTSLCKELTVVYMVPSLLLSSQLSCEDKRSEGVMCNTPSNLEEGGYKSTVGKFLETPVDTKSVDRELLIPWDQ